MYTFIDNARVSLNTKYMKAKNVSKGVPFDTVQAN